MRSEPARAEPSIASTDIHKPPHADDWIAEGCFEPIAEPRRVYDLTVEETHVFYANGILVHNCHDALQYVATRVFGDVVRGREEQRKRWNEPLNYPKRLRP